MIDQNSPHVAVRTYADRGEADAVIRALQQAGFRNDQISVVARDREAQTEMAEEHHVGAGTGAAIGIVEGAIIGLLAGVGGLLIPGIGALAVAGPLAGLLAGGIVGGLAGALAGWGIDAAEAKGYEERVSAGDVLVAVRDDDAARVVEARRIMDGGAAMTETATASTAMTASTMGTPRVGEDLRVPVMEEEMVAGKRTVEGGRAHVHKEVTEKQETVSAPVMHEEVRVERVPVTGDAAAMTDDAFVEQTIDVPVMGEELVAEKRARVAEEVRLRKQAVTEDEQVSDTVRKERVVVDGVDARDTLDETPVPATAEWSDTAASGGLRKAGAIGKDAVQGAADTVADDARRATGR